MNDHMYTNIRNYLQQLESLGSQILRELQRTNALLEGSQAQAEPVAQDEPAPKKSATKRTAKKGKA